MVQYMLSQLFVTLKYTLSLYPYQHKQYEEVLKCVSSYVLLYTLTLNPSIAETTYPEPSAVCSTNVHFTKYNLNC